MRHNKLTGKAAEASPEINNLTTPKRRPVAPIRGANRKERRAKEREVRLELKHIDTELPKIKKGTKEWYLMDLRKSELELWQSSPHDSMNKPYVKGRR